jgi:hypothetical protein
MQALILTHLDPDRFLREDGIPWRFLDCFKIVFIASSRTYDINDQMKGINDQKKIRNMAKKSKEDIHFGFDIMVKEARYLQLILQRRILIPEVVMLR